MRRKTALTATAIVSVVGLIVGWPQAIVGVLRALFPSLIWEMRTPDRVVAITFDDGPDPVFTPKVLEILRRYKITATFFLVGERVRRFPEVLGQIREEGHCVGNHSDSWRRTVQLGHDEFERDLLRAEQSLGLLDSPKLFRPAGGMIRADQIQVLRKHCYFAVLGSAYAFDPYRPPQKYIEWAITRGLKNGAIIVLHDSGGDRTHSVEALPVVIENAQAKGYRFVRLSEHLPGR
jgi:peptidoglycan/xylan/chitin deacetylase (PgdA/CDA1 family)